MNKDIAVALIAVLAVAGLTFGLHATVPEKPLTPSHPFEPGVAAGRGAAAKSSSPVVMRVNGEPITEAEFSMLIEQAPEEQRVMYASPAGRRALAEELVKIKVLAQEGRKLGLDREPNVSGQLGMIESQLLAAEAVKKLVGTSSEQELRAEYQKERASFETVELSHILVAYQGGQVPPRAGEPLSIEQATQKAAMIAARVRGGEDFGQVAANFSDDQQTAAQGGALGPVPVSAVPPEMRPAIENLKTGEISAPVRTTLGVHIFKAGKRQAKSFDEVRPALDQRIKQGRVQGAIAKAMAGAKVEKDEKFFADQVQPGGKSSS